MKQVNKVKELIKSVGLDPTILHKNGLGEYTLTVNGGHLPVRELHELGLTVTDIHGSNYDEEKLDMELSQKEDAKSIWYPPTYEEQLWIDCVIYKDIEHDVAHSMYSGIPLVHEISVKRIVKYLKYLKKLGYTNFIQAVGYMGMFGKYDENNCVATCIVCEQSLLGRSAEIGDAPLPNVYVDGTLGIKTSPVVVYVICHKCCQKHVSKEDTIPKRLVQRQIEFMLHSPDTRWIKDHRLAMSPFIEVGRLQRKSKELSK